MKRSQMRWFSHPITTAWGHNEVQREKELWKTLLSGRKWMDGWRRQRSHNLLIVTFNEKKHRIIYMFCDVNNSSITPSNLIGRQSYYAACAFCRLCPFCSCTGGVLLVNANWGSYFEKWNDCIWSNKASPELLHPVQCTFLWIIITTSVLPTPR